MLPYVLLLLTLMTGCSLVGYDKQSSDITGLDAGNGPRDAGASSTMDGAANGRSDASTDANQSMNDSGGGPQDGQAADAHNGDSGPCKGPNCPPPITTCREDNCKLDCLPDDPSCVLTCGASLACNVDCAVNGSCEVNCLEAKRCDVTCALGTRCDIDCVRAEDCRATCAAGSECYIDCRLAGNCDNVVCAVGAQCTLKCDVGDECGFALCPNGQEQACGGESNYHVCNAPCP